MGTLITKTLGILLQLAAGLGIGAILDKVAGDKLPSYPAGGVVPKNETGGLHFPKIAYWLISGVIGILLWNWISKKLKLKF